MTEWSLPCLKSAILMETQMIPKHGSGKTLDWTTLESIYGTMLEWWVSGCHGNQVTWLCN